MPIQGFTGFGGGATGAPFRSAADEAKYIDDVFNIYAYRGNGSSQSITNNIDMSSEGGMIWVKNRSSNQNHWLFSSAMGLGNGMRTNSNADKFGLGGNGMSSFNTNGFTVGGSAGVNNNAENLISWTFRNSKAFQTLTYEGTGSAQNISHSLGSIPGMIIVKNIDHTGTNWMVYHRSLGTAEYIFFNSTNPATSSGASGIWASAPTATQFSVGSDDEVTRDGDTYIAYLFAGGESTAATARSVDYDGSDDNTVFQNLSGDNADDLTFGTGDFTVEGWAQPDSIANTPAICDFRAENSGSSSTDGFWLGMDSGILKMWSGGAYLQSTGIQLYAGVWFHFAVVKSSGTIKIFINGKQSGADYTTSTNFNNSYYRKMRIGAGFTGADLWNGKISNFRVTKGQALYTTAFRPTIEPLTTTSQGATASNVKLLCCNNSSTTGSTVTPVTPANNGSPTATTDSPFDDPAGFVFGEDQDTNIFKMGTFQGNGSATGPEIYLGWEPQYVLIKRTDSAEIWNIFDSIRGISTPGNDQELYVQSSSLEYTNNRLKLTSTGFQPMTDNQYTNEDGGTFMYFCVRRSDGIVGKPIETGTEAMTVVSADGDTTGPCFATSFPVDFLLRRKPTGGNDDGSSGLNATMVAYHRLLGDQYLQASNGNQQATSSRARWWFNTGANHTDDSAFDGWLWKRHAGFDVITYTGTGNYHDLPHSLGRKPEMVWVKRRDADSTPWMVSHKGINGGTNYMHYYMKLNEDEAQTDGSGQGNKKFNTSSDHTATTIAIGNDSSWTNASGAEYVCLAFATVDGISKVGYYDGQGSDLTVTFGFQPRFLMVKRTDAAGDWNIYDTHRGLVSGADKEIRINNLTDQSDHEVGDITSTGFTFACGGVHDTCSAGKKFIYYAHA